MTQRTVWRKIVGFGSRPEVWLTALLLWTLASAGRSFGTPWAAAAGTELLRWAVGIGLALTLGGLLRRTEITGQVLVTLTGVMALLGVLGGTSAAGDLLGPYRDHQLYGSVLLLLLPFCAAAGLSAKSAPWRWAALAALAAGTLCLFLSETRSAWIGFGLSALVFGGLSLRQLASRPLRHFLPKRTVWVPCVLLGCGLAGVWGVTSPPTQKAALSSRAATLGALGQDESWQSRLALWRGTARLVTAQPALGIGLGRYPGSEWAWTHAGGLLAPGGRPSLTNQAHSFYGQTAAETGLIGLCLYLAVLLTFAAQGGRRLRESHRRRYSLSGQTALIIAALSALAGQSIDALASPSWQFPEVSLLFWAVLGVGLASLKSGTGAAVPAPASPRLQRVGRWALSGGLSVLLAAQILPLGVLLTPVEAYAAPAGDTLISVVVTQASPAGTLIPGSQLKVKVTATYRRSSSTTYSVDVTADKDTAYTGRLYLQTGFATIQASSVAGGVYTIPTLYSYSTTKSSIDIYVIYKDSGLHRPVSSMSVTFNTPVRPS